MRVAVVGYGSMGRRHAANAAALGHEVFAFDVRDRPPGPSPTRLWVGTDPVGMATDWGPDAVVVASPVEVHAEQLARLTALPVLVEKPLARTEAEVPEGLKDWRVTVGYNLRWHEGYRAVADWCRRREVVSVKLWVRSDRSRWPGLRYGETLLEYSHELDVALWLMGPLKLERAVSRDGGHGWHLWLRAAWSLFACGVEVRIEDDYAGYDRGGEVRALTGEQVDWVWREDGTFDAVVTGYSETWRTTTWRREFTAEDTYRAELVDWLAAVEAGRPLGPGVRAGAAVLRIADEARAWRQPSRG